MNSERRNAKFQVQENYWVRIREETMSDCLFYKVCCLCAAAFFPPGLVKKLNPNDPDPSQL